MAERLADRVTAQHIAWDKAGNGGTANHLTAWAWLAEHTPPNTWAVVLEDDAVPVPGFRHQVAAALATAPTPVVSLYLGRAWPRYIQPRIPNAIARATTTDAHWITARRLHHAVGVAIHHDHIHDMLNRVDPGQPIDETIGTWAAHRGLPVAYSWPSLVDHADLTSLISRDRTGQRRRAWRIGTRNPWTAKAVPL
ncbi:hypothetical protein [Mycolicibacterium porcinum]|uniref:Glycosyltransferase n=2 Tax=Mycolicibacterium porcinum TaxID=39693 RepID=A0ABV3VLZ1_9MYCO